MPDVDHTSDADRVGALFSTAATDNAEVVPPQAHGGPESMWSTAAKATVEADLDDGIAEGEVVDDRVTGEPADRPPPPPPPNDARWVAGGNAGAQVPPRFSGIFTAEPVERADDVVDEDDDVEADRAAFGVESGLRQSGVAPRPSTPSGEPLFSSSRVAPPTPDPWSPTDLHQTGPRNGARPSPFAAPTAAPAQHADEADRRARAAPAQRPRPPQPPPAPPASHGHPNGRANGHGSVGLDGRLGRDDGADPNGLRAAIARLDQVDVEQTAVPIAVCGALLQTGESVLGAVTGQMLGRPAVIVVTNRRVLVVNDRRWQPIVDEFAIDSRLVVRGRHDRNIAALSFADPTRLAMIDGITEVGLAIELAERIREAGST